MICIQQQNSIFCRNVTDSMYHCRRELAQNGSFPFQHSHVVLFMYKGGTTDQLFDQYKHPLQLIE